MHCYTVIFEKWDKLILESGDQEYGQDQIIHPFSELPEIRLRASTSVYIGTGSREPRDLTW